MGLRLSHEGKNKSSLLAGSGMDGHPCLGNMVRSWLARDFRRKM